MGRDEGGESDFEELDSLCISPWTMQTAHDQVVFRWEMTDTRTETDESLIFAGYKLDRVC